MRMEVFYYGWSGVYILYLIFQVYGSIYLNFIDFIFMKYIFKIFIKYVCLRKKQKIFLLVLYFLW